jgi:DNA-binding MarR family transcriptional regulator
MKNQLPQKRIKVYSFLKSNQPKSYTPKQIERVTGIKLPDLKGIIRDLLNLGRIRIERQEPGPTLGTLEYYYQAIPGQIDITPLIGTYGSKEGRKTTTTQATAWEAIERDPKRFSQKEKVYSYMIARRNKCYSRRQLEELLKIRVNSMTSVLKTLQEQNQVGIEKQDICEYTQQKVYFYFAIDPMQEPQKQMF